jgi:hypothetical protein
MRRLLAKGVIGDVRRSIAWTEAHADALARTLT